MTRRTGFVRARLAPFAMLAAALAAAAPAGAAGLRVSPSLSLEAESESNIFDAPEDETSDYIFRARPGLSVALDAFRSTATVSGSFEAVRYAEHDELDSTGSAKTLALVLSEPFRITPRFSLRPGARFVESRELARLNRILAEDPSMPPGETVVTARTKSRDVAGSLEASYLVSPTLDMRFAAAASRRSYPDDPVGLLDYRTIGGSIAAGYRVTPRLSAGVQGGATDTSSEGGPDSQTYTGALTARYSLARESSVEAACGAAFLRRDAPDGGSPEEEWSPYGRVSLTHAGGALRAALTGIYELSGGGSFGFPTRRATGILSLGGRLSSRWGWDLSGSYQTNRSTDAQVSVDLVTTSGEAGLAFQAARWLSVRLSGSLTRQWSHGTVGGNLQRQSAMLGLAAGGTFAPF